MLADALDCDSDRIGTEEGVAYGDLRQHVLRVEVEGRRIGVWTRCGTPSAARQRIKHYMCRELDVLTAVLASYALAFDLKVDEETALEGPIAVEERTELDDGIAKVVREVEEGALREAQTEESRTIERNLIRR